MDGVWNDEYHLPAGVEYTGRNINGDLTMRVSMPGDADGYFGRQCPLCSRMFRVRVADYDDLPDDQRLWCVYCGHHDDHSEFLTRQQLDRAMRAAGDIGVQLVGRALDQELSGLQRPRSHSSFVSVEYHTTPFHPDPLPDINEERLIRERTCAGCSLRYAVFGEHRYCPVCGLLPALTAALDALQAEITKLDALAALPAEQAAVLREQGVIHRVRVDTIKNLVGIAEALIGSVFRAAVTDADTALRGRGNIFQRLEDSADLYVTHGLTDFRTELGPVTWRRLIEMWAARHVFVHNDGIVDQRYRAAVPASRLLIGQRMTVSDEFCRQALADTEQLCRATAP
jgi:hypothetical protein